MPKKRKVKYSFFTSAHWV